MENQNQTQNFNLFVTVVLTLSDEIELTLRNFNIDTLKEMNRENVFGLLVHKWYMYGVYDTIGILGEKYVISKKTKKKIELIKYNAKS